MFLVLYGDAILRSRFRDLECIENRFLSSALGHLNVSFQIWWWLGLWSFKRFKLHQDEKGKEVHGKWKKERKWYSFFPLIYLLHQCSQIGLGIGNELRPHFTACAGRAGSRVCHPGGAASYRRAVKHFQRAFSYIVYSFVICDMSCVQVLHLCGPGGHHTMMRHKYRHTGTQADSQEMKRTHTHSQSITDTNTWEHLNTHGRPRLGGVSGSSWGEEGTEEEMVYSTTTIWTHHRESETPLKRLLLWV